MRMICLSTSGKKGRRIIKNRIISPVFKEYKNGKFTIVMMYAKHARGAMTRYLIKNQLNNGY